MLPDFCALYLSVSETQALSVWETRSGAYLDTDGQ